MSDRERLYQLLDTVPDTKIAYIIGYIQGITTDTNDVPNEETIEAMRECEQMIAEKKGQLFEGDTRAFLEMALED